MIKMIYANHFNDIGDWCPWSGEAVPPQAETDDPCPAGCRGSWVREVETTE